MLIRFVLSVWLSACISTCLLVCLVMPPFYYLHPFLFLSHSSGESVSACLSISVWLSALVRVAVLLVGRLFSWSICWWLLILSFFILIFCWIKSVGLYSSATKADDLFDCSHPARPELRRIRAGCLYLSHSFSLSTPVSVSLCVSSLPLAACLFLSVNAFSCYSLCRQLNLCVCLCVCCFSCLLLSILLLVSPPLYFTNNFITHLLCANSC